MAESRTVEEWVTEQAANRLSPVKLAKAIAAAEFGRSLADTEALSILAPYTALAVNGTGWEEQFPPQPGEGKSHTLVRHLRIELDRRRSDPAPVRAVSSFFPARDRALEGRVTLGWAPPEPGTPPVPTPPSFRAGNAPSS